MEEDLLPRVLAAMQHAARENVEQARVGDKKDADDDDVGSEDDPSDIKSNIDRATAIPVPELEKAFLLLDAFDGVDISDDDGLYVRFPWFDHEALSIENLFLFQCYSQDGSLPGGPPYETKRTWCWRNQLACREADIVVGHNRTICGVPADFVKLVRNGFNRLNT